MRLEQIRINIPKQFHSATNELILELGERQPSRLTFPIIYESETVSVEMIIEEEGLADTIIQISHDEPELDVIWIRGDGDLWLEILNSCKDLSSAGYPGCVGCGGPNSEQKWDEFGHRNSTNKYDSGEPRKS
ncbi:MAG TPA: hypothetical protein EYQ58_04035 [Candidatus Poseidoniales archaeon]|nr:hypothetical protein [Candidatus Poseidoniales archaeon]